MILQIIPEPLEFFFASAGDSCYLVWLFQKTMVYDQKKWMTAEATLYSHALCICYANSDP